MTRKAAWTVLAAAAWTAWVWGTRIWNLLGDPEQSFGFKAVHTLLALVSVGFAAALTVIGVKGLRSRSARRAVNDAAPQSELPAR